MPLSPIWEVVRTAAQMEQEGGTVIRLDIGGLPFPLPQAIREGLTAALDSGQTGYSPPGGIAEYLRACALRTVDRFSRAAAACKIDARWLQPRIVGSQGGTQALMSVIAAVCDPGDNLLLPEVAWPNYVEQTLMASAEPRFYRLNERFLPDPDQIAALIDDRTRALLINSPANPSGVIIPPLLLAELHHLAHERGLWLIDDLAYVDLVYEGNYLTALELDWQLPEAERCVIAVFSCSKSYAAAGLRLGYTVCPHPHFACDLAGLNDPLMGCLTTPLQHAMARGLLEDDPAARRERLARRWAECRRLQDLLGLAGPHSQGGLFAFIDISASGLNSTQFARRLLREQEVAVVPGAAFGMQPRFSGPRGLQFDSCELADRHIRVCFAADADRLAEGLQRIAAFITTLQQG